jgi:S1-C subfamily serine protease
MNIILNLIIILSIIFLLILGFNSIDNNKENFNNTLDNNLLKHSTVLIRNNMRNIDWNNPKDSIDTGVGSGSGFFIDKKHILTNYHVISNYSFISIKLPNVNASKNYECDVISVYPELDIALLKIKDYESNYYLELSTSDDDSMIGKEAYAIGYPLGMEQIKASKGVLNGIQDGYYQIDTPINPGNSGGPLINDKNKVIGIIFATLMFTDNIGFAIPITYVNNLIELMKNPPSIPYLINKPTLGMSYSNTSEEYINLLTLCNSGITVDQVLKGGPLENKIKSSDIICNIDGHNIDNFGYLSINDKKYNFDEYLFFKKPDSTVKLKYISNNELKEDNINLENKIYEKISILHYPFDDVNYFEYNGFIFMNLTLNHIINNIYNLEIKEGNLRFIDKGKVILTKKYIDNGKNTDLNNIINVPIIIKKINGYEVFNLDDVRKYYNQYENINGDNYFTMLTEDNTYYINKIK